MRDNAIRTIVVGTDFNELATAALRFAGEIARPNGAKLIVVYADSFEPPAEFTAGQVRHIADAIERSKKKTHEQLERYIAQHVPGGVAWKAIVADSLPATAISTVADAERADFIALGTHGRGGLQRLVIGSVAEAVIREAHVPVLTIRSAEIPRPIRRVLCPVNASSMAAAAAEQAGLIAAALGAELTLLQVSSGQDTGAGPGSPVPVQGAALRRLVVREDPAAEILEVADSGAYDLIVIAAEHKFVRDVTPFGTTAARVTRHARTPVLTVAHTAAGTQASVPHGTDGHFA
jgi:nucleotide-binding universal stress UspA family protein